MSAGHRSESVKLVARVCLALLSCSHSPETSLRSVIVIHEAEVSFRPYVLAQAFLQSHTRPHIHELVFSLCPYAVSGVALLFCCPQTGPFTAAPTRQKQSPRPPPPHLTELPPKSITHTPHTHKHNSPFSQKATAAGVLLRPLCDFRASRFNKVL